MTKEANRRLRRGGQEVAVCSLHLWIYLICSLVGACEEIDKEGECIFCFVLEIDDYYNFPSAMNNNNMIALLRISCSRPTVVAWRKFSSLIKERVQVSMI